MSDDSQKLSPFRRLGLQEFPVVLAPLAGVSDHPFRRLCQQNGADLTYVEMISATALCYESKNTLSMLARHPDEPILGVQVTGRTPEELGKAVEILDAGPFETIDINMGCPVNKVVRTGCGSGILKDVDRVFKTVEAARRATSRPLSAKIRLGWDRNSFNAFEVAAAIEAGGADWMTVHGRFRSDDYSVAVDLEKIGKIKDRVQFPVLGNGDVFCSSDVERMRRICGIDGVMVSRGALGNPWVFRQIRDDAFTLSPDVWCKGVLQHLRWQAEAYAGQRGGIVRLRKQLGWYMRGWPGTKALRQRMILVSDFEEAVELVDEVYRDLLQRQIGLRTDRSVQSLARERS